MSFFLRFLENHDIFELSGALKLLISNVTFEKKVILPYSDRLDHYKIASFGATLAPKIDITNLISKSEKVC